MKNNTLAVSFFELGEKIISAPTHWSRSNANTTLVISSNVTASFTITKGGQVLIPKVVGTSEVRLNERSMKLHELEKTLLLLT